MNRTMRELRWPWPVLCIAVFLALALRSNFLIDDAFISFRYARNWAEWGSPTYNRLEAPPVEGYSNFLWVFVLRWATELGLAPELVSRVLSMTAGVVLVLWTHRFLSRGLTLAPWAAGLGTLALATFPPFTVWSTGGLETTPFGLTLFVCFTGVLARTPHAHELRHGAFYGLVGLAVALLRPEGIAWVLGLAIVGALARRLDPQRRLAPARRVAGFLLTSGIGFGCFLLWRYSVYEAVLPNTVHAKAGLSGPVVVRGLKTVATYLLLFLSPLTLPAALSVSRKGGRLAWVGAALALYGAFLAYNVVVGGDWMPMFRFLAPATPFLAIGLAVLWERIGPRRGGALAAVSLALALLPAVGGSLVPEGLLRSLEFRSFRVGYQSEWDRLQRSIENLERFVQIGKGLRQRFGPEDSIAIGAIGAVGYYSGMIVYDRNGLVDPEVAALPVAPEARSAGHDKRVPRAWFLPRDPTVYQALIVEGRLEDPASPGFLEAARSLGLWVFNDPGEDVLKDHCMPVVQPLRAEDGIPENRSLILLQPTTEHEAARALWARLGF